jgi:hypothetical protein
MNAEIPDAEINQQIAEIIKEFTIFQCAECAEKIKQWLKIRRINGIHLKLTTVDYDDFILSERWDRGRDSITQNGIHYAIEVRGKVFDKLSTTGVSRQNWLNDFICRCGEFRIEEIDVF